MTAGAGGIATGAGGIVVGMGGIIVGAGGIIVGAGGIVVGAGGIVTGAGGVATPGPPGDKVLLYWGLHGRSPLGGRTFGTLLEAQDIYTAAGLSVDYTDVWPASLTGYRLAILMRQSGSTLFSDVEVDHLRALLAAGGVLVIGGETRVLIGWLVYTDLLTRLGSTITPTGVTTAPGSTRFTNIASNQFTAGVTTLMCEAGESLDPGNGICLFTPDRCIGAAEKIGAGTVIVIGDGNMIDDFALALYSVPGVDNRRFVANLAGVAP